VWVTKTVSVDELAQHLREYLDEVREGTTIQVVEDGNETVNISPTIIYPKSGKRLGDFKPGPRPPNLKTDSLKILMEDRHGPDYDKE